MDTRTPFTLQPGTLLRVPSSPGMRISVHAGRVWITEAGCIDDYFIDAGAAHEFTTHGLALVGHEQVDGYAVDAVVRIDAAQPHDTIIETASRQTSTPCATHPAPAHR